MNLMLVVSVSFAVPFVFCEMKDVGLRVVHFLIDIIDFFLNVLISGFTNFGVNKTQLLTC